MTIVGMSRLLATTLSVLPFIIPSPTVHAQIIPDATLPENSRVPSGCLTCIINGGTTRGTNLFHSFQEFSIPTGGTAWFNNVPAIQNILTRITGTFPSNIDGLVKANGTANLFFLNPNGIFFGSNARLELGGSFFASTASSFKFSDGSEFSATNPQAPPLLTINITPGLQLGSYQSGSRIINQGNLAVQQDLILKADRIELQGQLVAGRDLVVQAVDTVQVRDSPSREFQAVSGRNLVIQGDRGIDILALNHLNQIPFISRGDLSLISDGVISNDAHFAAGGTFRVKSISGKPATLTSLYDPIISATGDVEILGDYTGAALLIESSGSVRFSGNVQITGPDITLNPASPDPDIAALASSNALIVRATRNTLLYVPSGLPTVEGGATVNASSNLPLGITLEGNVFTGGGPIILDTARGSISTRDLLTISNSGGDVTLTTQNGNISTGLVLTLGFAGRGGNVRFETQNGNITVNSLINAPSVGGVPANGGSVRLATANGNVLLQSNINTFSFSGGNGGKIEVIAGNLNNSPALGNISTGEVNSISGNGRGGDIRIATNQGNITSTGKILSYSDNGNGGNISIQTKQGNIFLPLEADIQARSFGGNGGNVEVIANNGNINLDRIFSFATGNAGTVALTAPEGQINANLVLAHSFGSGNGANVSLLAGSPGIEAKALASFSINNRAGNLSLISSGNIQTTSLNATGKNGSGDILINSGGGFDLVLDTRTGGNRLGSPVITSDTFGGGNGGSVDITAQTVRIANGAQITTSTHSSGQGGNIAVRAADFVQIEGILPEGFSPGIGVPGGYAGVPAGTYLGGYIASGDVNNIGTERTLFPSGIYSQTTTNSTGNAGNILVETPRLVVQNQGAIASTTFGQGTGGDIQIRTNNGSVLLNNGSILSGVGTNASGSSGAIDLETGDLNLINAGLIQSQTLGAGDAGTIQIRATNSVQLAGTNTTIRTGSGNLQTNTGSIGKGANLSIATPSLRITDNASLSAETYTSSPGGNILVNGGQLTLSRGGQLRTTTFQDGAAGNIDLFLRDRLTLDDPLSGLFSDTALGSSGNGGNITVNTPQVTIQDGSAISVDSRGTGQGGSIFLSANSLLLNRRGVISAETASAQGGNITLNLRDILQLRRNSLISATAGTAQGGGDGGNITITAPFVIGVLSENSDIRANAFTGKGGNITINALGIFGLRFQPQDTPFSDITASSQFGISGTVTLNTLNVDPNRGLTGLSDDLVDASQQITQGCAPQTGQIIKTSRFVVVGRGGLPGSPDNLMSGDSPLVDLVDLKGTDVINSQQQPADRNPNAVVSASTSHQTGSPIIEAQSWETHADGSIELVAHIPSTNPQRFWHAPMKCSGF